MGAALRRCVVTWFDPAQRWCTWDTETHSPIPTEARLVTACVAFVGGGEPTEVMSWVADAGVEIPDGAAEIHGYTTERVRAEGKPIADVLPEIVGYLAGAVTAGLPLVAYNGVYDNTVLNCETVRLGLDPFADVLAKAVVFDPFTIDKHIDRYRPGKRTLTAACETYDVRLDGAHDSTFDALAAARVLYRIGQRSQMPADKVLDLYADRRYPRNFVKSFAALGAMSATELHEAQQGWYREQAEGLATYWLREAAGKQTDAGLDFPPGDETLTVDERREVLLRDAEELRQRAESVNTSWPIQAVSP